MVLTEPRIMCSVFSLLPSPNGFTNSKKNYGSLETPFGSVTKPRRWNLSKADTFPKPYGDALIIMYSG